MVSILQLINFNYTDNEILVILYRKGLKSQILILS